MLLILLLIPISLFAQTELYHQKKWLNLLHYKKTLTGYESQADSKGFFLDSNGKNDPKRELEESVSAFRSATSVNDDHPVCKFPLRYKWLNQKHGGTWRADLSGCSRYISFFSKMAARRASIIFSSYYLTNPSSAFGHTLLRLSRYTDKNETELLDYGINFAAKARESNPFLYAWKGLFGGFVGEFSAVPYYYKIREYSDFEFRDLWAFDLKLSTGEVLELVDHIWELGSTHFDYFYLQENCSYHLLSLLEVVRPELDLTGQFRFYAIPADTIRVLHRADLLEVGERRESTFSRLTRMSGKLSFSELQMAKAIALRPELAKPEDNVEVLDVAIEAFDYKNFKEVLKDDPMTMRTKEPLLRARALNPTISPLESTLRVSSRESPVASHPPGRWTIAENYFHGRGKSSRFEFRPALHDLLDPPAGALREAQLEMGRISFELQERDYGRPRLILDSFSLFSLKNLPRQSFWANPLAWEVELGAKQLRRECFNCPAAFLSGSMGNSFTIGNVLLAFLVNGEMDVQSQFENSYRAGIGPKFIGRITFGDRWIAGLQSWYHFNTYEHEKIFEDYEWWNELELRHHFSSIFSLSMRSGGIERIRTWIPFGEIGLQYFYE